MGVFSHWPNRITALRFVGAVVLFAILALAGDPAPEGVAEIRPTLRVAFWLFIVTAATDVLDGYLARRDRTVTAFGRIADPFVDKVLILGTFIFLAVLPWSRPWLPAWIVVVILAREFLVTGIRGYVESLGAEFPADRFGKLKMLLQSITVAVLFFLHAFDWPAGWFAFWSSAAHALVWASLVTTVGSGLAYVAKTGRILREAAR